MSALSGLKLVSAKRSAKVSPAIHRRTKLLKKLTEQIELAKAQKEGRQYVATRVRLVKDAGTGARTAVDVSKRVREWWWTGENGCVFISLRYGAKPVEIAKGKSTVEVTNGEDLVAVLETLRRAVESGELDGQIEAVSVALRAGFKK